MASAKVPWVNFLIWKNSTYRPEIGYMVAEMLSIVKELGKIPIPEPFSSKNYFFPWVLWEIDELIDDQISTSDPVVFDSNRQTCGLYHSRIELSCNIRFSVKTS